VLRNRFRPEDGVTSYVRMLSLDESALASIIPQVVYKAQGIFASFQAIHCLKGSENQLSALPDVAKISYRRRKCDILKESRLEYCGTLSQLYISTHYLLYALIWNALAMTF
jgi:hypothetical protein